MIKNRKFKDLEDPLSNKTPIKLMHIIANGTPPENSRLSGTRKST